MRVAYLVNRYPASSHSFIRREIEAVEAQGTAVSRFSIRQSRREELPDPRDQAEYEKTSVLLDLGGVTLFLLTLRAFAKSPGRNFSALRIAFSKSDWNPRTWVRRAAYFAEAAALADRIRAQSVDHIHAHFGTNPAMVARIAGALTQASYSFTVHGPDEFDAPIALDLKGKVADSAFCVAISNFGRGQLMRWSGPEHWHKIQVVRCGLDGGFLREERDLAPVERPQLCCVARLSAQKGIPLLLSAVSMVKSAGYDFELSLIGGGEMAAQIGRKIEEEGLTDTVKLAGWLSSDEVKSQLIKSRVMVLPSFAEGLPVVIMEALALKTPVIVTAIAGTPELVDDECGWLISSGSVEKLAEAMIKALEASPEHLQALGENGRSRVLAQHDAALNGQELNTLFRAAVRPDD
ncbi:MAG: glycosyltransferase family 4 protein [Pseudomonadota bacterium]